MSLKMKQGIPADHLRRRINPAIPPTKNNYLALLKTAYTVNIYPQAINRMSSNDNKKLSTLSPCDLQIISQQKGVNLAI
jgi:hypothetical protein